MYSFSYRLDKAITNYNETNKIDMIGDFAYFTKDIEAFT